MDVTGEIERLQQEHSDLEQRLQSLTRGVRLTPDEELEVRALKRRKLQTKDRIQALSQGGK